MSGAALLAGVTVGSGTGVLVWPGPRVTTGVGAPVGVGTPIGGAVGPTGVGNGETCETGGSEGCGAQCSPVGHGGSGGLGWLNRTRMPTTSASPTITPTKMAMIAVGLAREGCGCGLKYPPGGT
jgi:hypothetical protein